MTKQTTVNILFCGRGGQGILAAAEVCSWAAVFSGYHVKKSEVHGMAQRGGSVESHVRFGKKIFSPLIPRGEADFIVPSDAAEFSRLKGFLKKEGTGLIEELHTGEASLNENRYINVYLLGVLSRYLPIDEQCWMRAIDMVLAGKNTQENKDVFLTGRRKDGSNKGEVL
jgi:indolepyruvate ferredoxin oxidoreductase beta subunit